MNALASGVCVFVDKEVSSTYDHGRRGLSGGDMDRCL